MSKHSYQPEIRSKISDTRVYQKHVDQMMCRFPGCKRWRMSAECDRCEDHRTVTVMVDRAKDCHVLRKGRAIHALGENL